MKLKLLEKAGEIADLQVHPRWALRANSFNGTLALDGTVIGHYTADFSYRPTDRVGLIVEDVKGGRATSTEAYRLRKKIFEANYGLTITEIGSAARRGVRRVKPPRPVHKNIKGNGRHVG